PEEGDRAVQGVRAARDRRAQHPRAEQDSRADPQADVATYKIVGIAVVADRARRILRQRLVALQGGDGARRANHRALRRLLSAISPARTSSAAHGGNSPRAS